MTLDQYQLCPCGSGKKIKFCCSKEFIADLDRIQRMVQGDQRLAAAEKIASLLEKYPDRPSLLMIRADIEMALRETEKARATVAKLAEVDGNNPSVAAMMSLLAVVMDGNLSAAIHYLQEAFNRATGTIPVRVYESIVVVAQGLKRAGYSAAAKGHLQLALALSNAEDERSAKALMQLNHDRSSPLLLREPLSLVPPPDGVTWRIEFDATMREIYRGRWRRGAEQLSMMAIRILDEPSILFNQAVVYIWLADHPKAVKALRDFARIRTVPLDDRVHAAALIEYLDPDKSKDQVEVVEVTYNVEKLDSIMERATAEPTFENLPLNPESQADDQPMPRAVYQICDKVAATDAIDIKLEDIPAAQGLLILFGKETDRPARVVLQCPRTRLELLTKRCETLFEQPLGEPTEEHVGGHIPRLASEVFVDWRLPEKATTDVRQRLSAELRQRAMDQNYVTTPMPRLDDKSPKEAATEGSKYHVPILATLLNLELQAEDSQWEYDFNAMRTSLGVPTRDPIDPSTVNLERLPVHRISLVDPKPLNDEQLLTVYRRSYAVMAVAPLRKIALEVISRASLDEKIDKVEAYDILSDVAVNTDEALAYLDKARKLATAEGESPAAWLIDEMEIRLIREEIDKFVNLMKEIQTRYIKEPGIAAALVETLSRYGLVTPDGRLMIPVPRDQAEEATSGVWTPGSDAPVAARGEESKSESKLWIPD